MPLGTDIGLSNRGLVVNEANASPLHLTYQMTGQYGRMHPDLRLLFRLVLAKRDVTGPQKGTPWPWI